MPKPAFISTVTNNIIYISSYPVEATVKDIDNLYNEIEAEISKLKGPFITITNFSNVKWIDVLPRLKIVERSQRLSQKHTINYLGKILISNNNYTDIVIELLTLITKNTASQYTVRTLEAAKRTASDLFNKRKFQIELK